MINQINKDKNLLKFKKYFFIFLTGFFASLSLPPLSFFPIVFLITIPLFYLVNSKNLKDAFLIGYFFSFWMVSSITLLDK
jgi:apolipoprotein N-acyltransferase